MTPLVPRRCLCTPACTRGHERHHFRPVMRHRARAQWQAVYVPVLQCVLLHATPEDYTRVWACASGKGMWCGCGGTKGAPGTRERVAGARECVENACGPREVDAEAEGLQEYCERAHHYLLVRAGIQRGDGLRRR
ncbi:hypothetical protein FA95DRAFT_1568004 [Auriscalpium vulgare]|uniref:Uncharacterized protein n=1 Tax=Auriscalpium vulgare TaxID=40419 RepID=A0ACB8R1Y6_9AGAM|nr:hypothetical protein FA95DRAFT_1568004 [Auriscalpium vulgare]